MGSICGSTRENNYNKNNCEYAYAYNKNKNNQNNIDINNINKQYNNTKINNIIFYEDVEVQEKYLMNYKSFVSEMNYQISDLKDHLYISLAGQKQIDNMLSKKENLELLENLEIISDKIHEFESLLERQKNELKILENNYRIIQGQFNEIKKYESNSQGLIDYNKLIKSDSIKQHLNENKIIINNLNNNKIKYEGKRIEIENYIKIIQSMTEEKVTRIKQKRKENLKTLHITKNKKGYYNKLNDSLFLKGSMLFGIKDFKNAKDKFKSMYLFKEDENDDLYEEQKLLKRNWHKTCYIYDDYDIYDITYELKAVGISEDMNFTSSFFVFVMDTNIEILLFEIDGIQSNYEYEKYSLRFEIKLKNLEKNNIHIKYKESPLVEKMTEGQKAIRKIYRCKYYGLSNRLVGETAKFILKNTSNFEIINFENEFLLKTRENEYQWGGIVPEGGKETIIRMSKKESEVNFYEYHVIRSIDNSYIKNTERNIPFGYIDGNNQLIKFNYKSKQTNRINLDQNKKVINIKYINTKSNIGDLSIQGILRNRCKGEWKIKLTNEEIDSLVPRDYKTYKETFKKISYDIIKSYDAEHKDDDVIVPNVTKIGKWIKKNIKYDITLAGLSNITAMETYNSRKGVCDHFTKLFNALMYSLGYQVLYAEGFANDQGTEYGIQNAHAWSIIKIEGKWFPFDSTWGIFSGKLPVTHVFKRIKKRKINTVSYDRVKIDQIYIKGNII